ncbi:LysR family transcriptional regulator [Stenotrophomonas indicatrix]|uniref:LysR family transcriptional regulator n=1 Tax=Stenotrophomonas lactitubi TaxID=2045214 RepID=UPI001D7C48F3|nr:LysR family transcriptional regulator [Stenotrophomonas lactitubi]CAH0225441.1 HTH-type transcriptional regulator DmlR [Stenotrophomonas lactitubi]
MDLIAPLRSFAKVAEVGSFSAAAEALDLSPQLVGKHVQTLEQHLGVRLLNRTTRKQSLTDFGQAYLARARVILEEVESAEQLAEIARGRPMGRLRISAPVTFGVHALGPAVVAYMQQYPDVQVDLNLSNSLVNVVEDGYDLVFRTGDLADSGLVARRLGPYPLALCAAPRYLAARPPIVHPQDLSRHECLGFAHSVIRTRWSFHDPQGGVLTVPVSSRFMVNQAEPLLTAAVGGLGLILQPFEMMAAVLASGELVEVLPRFVPVSTSINLLYPHHRQVTAKLRSFLDFCVARFTEQSMARAR